MPPKGDAQISNINISDQTSQISGHQQTGRSCFVLNREKDCNTLKQQRVLSVHLNTHFVLPLYPITHQESGRPTPGRERAKCRGRAQRKGQVGVLGLDSLADCWNMRATGNPDSRKFLRQPPVRQIISIRLTGQKHCEDHSTLGNCKSTKARGICVTLPHTHTHLHPLSSPSLQCVTTWNSMPRGPLVFKYSALARLDLNPEHVARELCHCVKALIRYARPTFWRICA